MSIDEALMIFPQKPRGTRRRTKSKILLGEGTHEAYLFAALFRLLGRDNIQAATYGGKGNLARALEALVTLSGDGDLETVGITRDANGNFGSAWQAAISALENANSALSSMEASLPRFSIPDDRGTFVHGEAIRVGIFIMPDNQSTGMMETLCLRSVDSRDEMACVEAYFDCLANIDDWSQRPQGHDKARAHAFLAACDPPDKHPGAACGDRSTAALWDLEHFALDPLKAFIGDL